MASFYSSDAETERNIRPIDILEGIDMDMVKTVWDSLPAVLKQKNKSTDPTGDVFRRIELMKKRMREKSTQPSEKFQTSYLESNRKTVKGFAEGSRQQKSMNPFSNHHCNENCMRTTQVEKVESMLSCFSEHNGEIAMNELCIESIKNSKVKELFEAKTRKYSEEVVKALAQIDQTNVNLGHYEQQKQPIVDTTAKLQMKAKEICSMAHQLEYEITKIKYEVCGVISCSSADNAACGNLCCKGIVDKIIDLQQKVEKVRSRAKLKECFLAMCEAAKSRINEDNEDLRKDIKKAADIISEYKGELEVIKQVVCKMEGKNISLAQLTPQEVITLKPLKMIKGDYSDFNGGSEDSEYQVESGSPNISSDEYEGLSHNSLEENSDKYTDNECPLDDIKYEVMLLSEGSEASTITLENGSEHSQETYSYEISEEFSRDSKVQDENLEESDFPENQERRSKALKNEATQNFGKEGEADAIKTHIEKPNRKYGDPKELKKKPVSRETKLESNEERLDGNLDDEEIRMVSFTITTSSSHKSNKSPLRTKGVNPKETRLLQAGKKDTTDNSSTNNDALKQNRIRKQSINQPTVGTSARDKELRNKELRLCEYEKNVTDKIHTCRPRKVSENEKLEENISEAESAQSIFIESVHYGSPDRHEEETIYPAKLPPKTDKSRAYVVKPMSPTRPQFHRTLQGSERVTNFTRNSRRNDSSSFGRAESRGKKDDRKRNSVPIRKKASSESSVIDPKIARRNNGNVKQRNTLEKSNHHSSKCTCCHSSEAPRKPVLVCFPRVRREPCKTRPHKKEKHHENVSCCCRKGESSHSAVKEPEIHLVSIPDQNYVCNCKQDKTAPCKCASCTCSGESSDKISEKPISSPTSRLEEPCMCTKVKNISCQCKECTCRQEISDEVSNVVTPSVESSFDKPCTCKLIEDRPCQCAVCSCYISDQFRSISCVQSSIGSPGSSMPNSVDTITKSKSNMSEPCICDVDKSDSEPCQKCTCGPRSSRRISDKVISVISSSVMKQESNASTPCTSESHQSGPGESVTSTVCTSPKSEISSRCVCGPGKDTCTCRRNTYAEGEVSSYHSIKKVEKSADSIASTCESCQSGSCRYLLSSTDGTLSNSKKDRSKDKLSCKCKIKKEKGKLTIDGSLEKRQSDESTSCESTNSYIPSTQSDIKELKCICETNKGICTCRDISEPKSTTTWVSDKSKSCLNSETNTSSAHTVITGQSNACICDKDPELCTCHSKTSNSDGPKNVSSIYPGNRSDTSGSCEYSDASNSSILASKKKQESISASESSRNLCICPPKTCTQSVGQLGSTDTSVNSYSGTCETNTFSNTDTKSKNLWSADSRHCYTESSSENYSYGYKCKPEESACTSHSQKSNQISDDFSTNDHSSTRCDSMESGNNSSEISSCRISGNKFLRPDCESVNRCTCERNKQRCTCCPNKCPKTPSKGTISIRSKTGERSQYSSTNFITESGESDCCRYSADSTEGSVEKLESSSECPSYKGSFACRSEDSTQTNNKDSICTYNRSPCTNSSLKSERISSIDQKNESGVSSPCEYPDEDSFNIESKGSFEALKKSITSTYSIARCESSSSKNSSNQINRSKSICICGSDKELCTCSQKSPVSEQSGSRVNSKSVISFSQENRSHTSHPEKYTDSSSKSGSSDHKSSCLCKSNKARCTCCPRNCSDSPATKSVSIVSIDVADKTSFSVRSSIAGTESGMSVESSNKTEQNSSESSGSGTSYNSIQPKSICACGSIKNICTCSPKKSTSNANSKSVISLDQESRSNTNSPEKSTGSSSKIGSSDHKSNRCSESTVTESASSPRNVVTDKTSVSVHSNITGTQSSASIESSNTYPRNTPNTSVVATLSEVFNPTSAEESICDTSGAQLSQKVKKSSLSAICTCQTNEHGRCKCRNCTCRSSNLVSSSERSSSAICNCQPKEHGRCECEHCTCRSNNFPSDSEKSVSSPRSSTDSHLNTKSSSGSNYLCNCNPNTEGRCQCLECSCRRKSPSGTSSINSLTQTTRSSTMIVSKQTETDKSSNGTSGTKTSTNKNSIQEKQRSHSQLIEDNEEIFCKCCKCSVCICKKYVEQPSRKSSRATSIQSTPHPASEVSSSIKRSPSVSPDVGSRTPSEQPSKRSSRQPSIFPPGVPSKDDTIRSEHPSRRSSRKSRQPSTASTEDIPETVSKEGPEPPAEDGKTPSRRSSRKSQPPTTALPATEPEIPSKDGKVPDEHPSKHSSRISRLPSKAPSGDSPKIVAEEELQVPSKGEKVPSKQPSRRSPKLSREPSRVEEILEIITDEESEVPKLVTEADPQLPNKDGKVPSKQPSRRSSKLSREPSKAEDIPKVITDKEPQMSSEDEEFPIEQPSRRSSRSSRQPSKAPTDNIPKTISEEEPKVPSIDEKIPSGRPSRRSSTRSRQPSKPRSEIVTVETPKIPRSSIGSQQPSKTPSKMVPEIISDEIIKVPSKESKVPTENIPPTVSEEEPKISSERPSRRSSRKSRQPSEPRSEIITAETPKTPRSSIGSRQPSKTPSKVVPEVISDEVIKDPSKESKVPPENIPKTVSEEEPKIPSKDEKIPSKRPSRRSSTRSRQPSKPRSEIITIETPKIPRSSIGSRQPSKTPSKVVPEVKSDEIVKVPSKESKVPVENIPTTVSEEEWKIPSERPSRRSSRRSRQPSEPRSEIVAVETPEIPRPSTGSRKPSKTPSKIIPEMISDEKVEVPSKDSKAPPGSIPKTVSEEGRPSERPSRRSSRRSRQPSAPRSEIITIETPKVPRPSIGSPQPSKTPSKIIPEIISDENVMVPNKESKVPAENIHKTDSEEEPKIPSDRPSRRSSRRSRQPSAPRSEIITAETPKIPRSPIGSRQPSKIPSKIISDEKVEVPSEDEKIPSERPSRRSSRRSRQPSKLPAEEVPQIIPEEKQKTPNKNQEISSEQPSKRSSRIPSEQPSRRSSRRSRQPSIAPSEDIPNVITDEKNPYTPSKEKIPSKLPIPPDGSLREPTKDPSIIQERESIPRQPSQPRNPPVHSDQDIKIPSKKPSIIQEKEQNKKPSMHLDNEALIKACETKLLECQTKNEQFGREKEVLEANRLRLEDDLTKCRKDFQDCLAGQLDEHALGDQISTLQKENSNLHNQLEVIKATVIKLQIDNGTLLEKNKQLTNELGEIKTTPPEASEDCLQYIQKMSGLEAEIASLIRKNETDLKEYSDCKAKLDSCQNDLAKCMKELAKPPPDTTGELIKPADNADCQQWIDLVSQYEGKLKQYRVRTVRLTFLLAIVEKDRDTLKSEKKELEKSSIKCQEDLKQCLMERDASQPQSQMDSLQQQLEKQKVLINELEQKITSLTNLKDDATKEAQSAQEKLLKCEEEVQLIAERGDSYMAEQYTNLRKENNELKTEIDDRKKDIERLITDLQLCHSQLADCKSKLAACEAKLQALPEQIRTDSEITDPNFQQKVSIPNIEKEHKEESIHKSHLSSSVDKIDPNVEIDSSEGSTSITGPNLKPGSSTESIEKGIKEESLRKSRESTPRKSTTNRPSSIQAPSKEHTAGVKQMKKLYKCLLYQIQKLILSLNEKPCCENVQDTLTIVYHAINWMKNNICPQCPEISNFAPECIKGEDSILHGICLQIVVAGVRSLDFKQLIYLHCTIYKIGTNFGKTNCYRFPCSQIKEQSCDPENTKEEKTKRNKLSIAKLKQIECEMEKTKKLLGAFRKCCNI
ncbi:unnamed protein product [Hermetia illucens]|uniref:Uncharacterized protein n=1 Tax=Hermetia illucens TaxID=343691 RepID=A0A7R8UPF9_HERIL|nr:uncharacterized protein LOC119652020 [Hermetia illucens]CAD7084584.1 unnamed protein product [Hermetia illucens]